MIVRLGNAAPVHIKTHDVGCYPGCPARHDVVTGLTPQVDELGDPILDESGQPVLVPVVESVHDGTKERVVVELSPGETYRVTTSDVNVEDTDEAKSAWLDRAFTSIISPDGAWANVSDQPPLWVESNWADLERKLAAWFDCPIGEPT